MVLAETHIVHLGNIPNLEIYVIDKSYKLPHIL